MEVLGSRGRTDDSASVEGSRPGGTLQVRDALRLVLRHPSFSFLLPTLPWIFVWVVAGLVLHAPIAIPDQQQLRLVACVLLLHYNGRCDVPAAPLPRVFVPDKLAAFALANALAFCKLFPSSLGPVLRQWLRPWQRGSRRRQFNQPAAVLAILLGELRDRKSKELAHKSLEDALADLYDGLVHTQPPRLLFTRAGRGSERGRILSRGVYDKQVPSIYFQTSVILVKILPATTPDALDGARPLRGSVGCQALLDRGNSPASTRAWGAHLRSRSWSSQALKQLISDLQPAAFRHPRCSGCVAGSVADS
eukprot:scaffold8179_cov430-Prasinococcus_capsulatus_cf.AAC.12